MAGKNPIYKVGTQIDGSGRIIGGTIIPAAPSGYDFNTEDISKSNAGRTQDLTMHKNRIGRVKAVSLTFSNIPFSDASVIVKAFKPEYIYAEYLDGEDGIWVTAGFYTGKISMTGPNTKTMKWDNLSFQITTRKNAL